MQLINYKRPTDSTTSIASEQANGHMSITRKKSTTSDQTTLTSGRRVLRVDIRTSTWQVQAHGKYEVQERQVRRGKANILSG